MTSLEIFKDASSGAASSEDEKESGRPKKMKMKGRRRLVRNAFIDDEAEDEDEPQRVPASPGSPAAAAAEDSAVVMAKPSALAVLMEKHADLDPDPYVSEPEREEEVEMSVLEQKRRATEPFPLVDIPAGFEKHLSKSVLGTEVEKSMLESKKGGTSHHQSRDPCTDRRMPYYLFHDGQTRDSLSQMIATQFVTKKTVAFTFSEHKHEEFPFLLWVDVDTSMVQRKGDDKPSEDHDLQLITSCLQNEVVKYVKGIPSKYKALLNKMEHMAPVYKKYGFRPAKFDLFTIMVFRARGVDGGDDYKYHLYWPFVRVQPIETDNILKAMRECVMFATVNFPTNKIEIPLSLRMPYCDKFDKVYAGRPYIFHCVYDCEARKQLPTPTRGCYPFPDSEDVGRFELEHHIAMCTTQIMVCSQYWSRCRYRADELKKLMPPPRPVAGGAPPAKEPTSETRFAELVSEFGGAFDIPTELVWKKSATDRSIRFSATRWYSYYKQYDAQELKDFVMDPALSGNYEQQCKRIVDYTNLFLAVMDGGVVLYKSRDGNTGRVRLTQLKDAAAKSMFALKVPLLEEGKKKASMHRVYDIWESHPLRMCINSVVFQTNPETPLADNTLNLYKGLRYNFKDCEPHKDFVCDDVDIMGYPASLSDFLDLLWNVICDKDEHVYRFLIQWAASGYQQPWVASNTCFLFAGREGIGKTLAAKALCYGHGEHFKVICSKTDLLGKFNNDTRGITDIVLNEISKLDPDENDALLRLITEPEKRFEEKFQIRTELQYAQRLILTKNKPGTKTMHVSESSRRYCILECRDFREIDHEERVIDADGNHSTKIVHGQFLDEKEKVVPTGGRVEMWNFFNKVVYWLEGGKYKDDRGYKCLMYYLFTVDLEGFPSPKPVTTRLLLQQRLNSLPKEAHYLFECINRASFDSDNVYQWNNTGPNYVIYYQLSKSYSEFFDHGKTSKRLDQRSFLNVVENMRRFIRGIKQEMRCNPNIDELDALPTDPKQLWIRFPPLLEAKIQFESCVTDIKILTDGGENPANTYYADEWIPTSGSFVKVYSADQMAAKKQTRQYKL